MAIFTCPDINSGASEQCFEHIGKPVISMTLSNSIYLHAHADIDSGASEQCFRTLGNFYSYTQILQNLYV